MLKAAWPEIPGVGSLDLAYASLGQRSDSEEVFGQLVQLGKDAAAVPSQRCQFERELEKYWTQWCATHDSCRELEKRITLRQWNLLLWKDSRLLSLAQRHYLCASQPSDQVHGCPELRALVKEREEAWLLAASALRRRAELARLEPHLCVLSLIVESDKSTRAIFMERWSDPHRYTSRWNLAMWPVPDYQAFHEIWKSLPAWLHKNWGLDSRRPWRLAGKKLQ